MPSRAGTAAVDHRGQAGSLPSADGALRGMALSDTVNIVADGTADRPR